MAVIIGDGAANVLTGTPDSDTIRGGGGADTLYGLAGRDLLYGEAGNDTLDGGDGNDLLDGGSSADTMRGGAGNDVYSVNSVGDRVDETLAGAPGGRDTVFASIAFTLGANFENLHLGVGAGGGTGNALANVITGNVGAEALYGFGGDDTLFGKEGNDVLDGGKGADRMEGGDGNDLYYVDNAGDVAFDRTLQGGHDTVIASVDYRIGSNVEDLTLVGTARVGEGNGWANHIIGTEGANQLAGWGGDDVFEGRTAAGRARRWRRQRHGGVPDRTHRRRAPVRPRQRAAGDREPIDRRHAMGGVERGGRSAHFDREHNHRRWARPDLRQRSHKRHQPRPGR